MSTMVITGAMVIDGTGAPPRLADVHVSGDRIVAVTPRSAQFALAPEAKRINATGCTVMPGLIDAHTRDTRRTGVER